MNVIPFSLYFKLLTFTKNKNKKITEGHLSTRMSVCSETSIYS